MNLQQELEKRFGFDEFRPGQQETIQSILDGRDTLSILPTGIGKSLCYQLPGELLEGLVLIVSPLVSLMEDQVASIRKRGEKRVAAINSFLSNAERRQLYNDISNIKFLFVSPEMINRPEMARFLTKLSISLIVVDEAHCISQWGFDFRPDYLRLGEFIKQLKNPPILALTATADARVESDIVEYLCMTEATIIRQSLDRPNLMYTVHRLDTEHEKTLWIKERLTSTAGPGIIYVSSRKRAEQLTALLKQEDIQIASYHAGKEAEDRNIIQQQFLSGELTWICATNAFGMGVHKENVRQVIHEQMPASAAAYVQEAGRAGRDGKFSSAVLLYAKDDEQRVRFIVQHDLPEEPEIRHFISMIEAGRTAEAAADFAGISETAARLIRYYKEKLATEEMIQTFTRLKFDKEEKLRQMIAYVSADTCLRNQLLYYFDETSTVNRPVCCSVCGITKEDWLYPSKNPENRRVLLQWEDRFRLLLC